MNKVLFCNARIITEDKRIDGNILVENGKIAAITDKKADADQVIDCGGKYLFPGVIDTHVHFREPSPNEQEDFASGTMSAAAGGVTCVIEHPLDVPPVLDKKSFENKVAAIERKAYIDYGLWGGVTGRNLDKLGELKKQGVFAFKAFMCASDPLFPMVTDGELLTAMKKISEMGDMIGLHAENNDIICYNREHYSESSWENETHGQMRPVVAELEAISRAILFAESAGTKLHVLHMGIWEGAKLIQKAKARGIDVTAETCPHYLCLNEELFAAKGPDAKCCPPLRDAEHMRKLWNYVFDGTIDMIVSDHSPYTPEEKLRGWQDMLLAPPGITGVQTGLQMMLSEACNKRGMSLVQLSALMSTNAAKRFGLYGAKGAIREGFDADFALIDMEKPWVISRDELFYKNKNSAFVGYVGKGKAVASYVRGTCVWDEAKGFPQGAGFGKLLRAI